jgi:ABC-type polysaccharide transport system permease subunit
MTRNTLRLVVLRLLPVVLVSVAAALWFNDVHSEFTAFTCYVNDT